jgi:hypothetical protein
MRSITSARSGSLAEILTRKIGPSPSVLGMASSPAKRRDCLTRRRPRRARSASAADLRKPRLRFCPGTSPGHPRCQAVAI